MILKRGRYPLMALSLVALLAALWAGLIRLGWQLPALSLPVGQHGPLILSAFFGTLVSLERAVALERRWAYLAPGLSALGGVLLLAGALPLGDAARPAAIAARLLITLGSAALVAVFAYIVRARPDAAHGTMGVGAVLWLAGNVLWLQSLWLVPVPLARVVPWWAGFLVLTIAGERLELARVLALRRLPRRLFFAACALFIAGLLLSLVTFDAGVRVAGAGLLALGAWLLRYDIARRTIRQRGLTRFIAACLLPGYAWLAAGGLLWLAQGGQYVSGPRYDASLHTILLGFVFSMIFGHAPIILAGVLRVPVPYHPSFYAHLVVLHAALIARIAGDLWPWAPLRMWGGMFNVVAVLLFLGVTAGFVARARAPLGAPAALESRQAH